MTVGEFINKGMTIAMEIERSQLITLNSNNNER